MIINLAFLNSSNGMFWYAMDKIKTSNIDLSSWVVLVGPELLQLVARELPDVEVRSCGRLEAIAAILRAKAAFRSRFRLVTFTSHPLPFLRAQTIAFYDTYPFTSRLGPLKRWLFIIAVRTSRTRVGIINRSLAVPFLKDCGVLEARIFFESAFPAVAFEAIEPRPTEPGEPMRVGLVGTDSQKKNYASIFRSIVKRNSYRKVRFVIYGSDNAYIRDLRRHFPKIDLHLVESDTIGMTDFFSQIDYLVSASTEEGYGRPMGLAVQFGVPLYLLKSPVFLEFFGDHAHFFDNSIELIDYILDNRPSPSSAPPRDLSACAPEGSFFA